MYSVNHPVLIATMAEVKRLLATVKPLPAMPAAIYAKPLI